MPRRNRRLSYPTLSLALMLYGSFFLLTWFFTHLPLWIGAPLGCLLLALHGSFQHETIHGHPTCSRRINTLLAGPPLSLWIPYELYRQNHLRHHRHGGRYLTHPTRDTESFYLPPGTLGSARRIQRVIYSANCTLAGRLMLGPMLVVYSFWAGEARKLRDGDRRRLSIWSCHVLGVGAVLAWTVGICHVPLLVYAGLMVYPAISITLLRSFIEHRADADPKLRTAVVEAGPLWALIFLNNNLHIAHHAHPKLPWYELPRVWRQMRGAVIGAGTAGSGLVFQRGYLGVIRAYLFRPAITIEHPAPLNGR